MRSTCKHTKDMSKMIQIRDVPDEVHSTLKARAARAGMSLSGFLRREITRTTEQPTIEEWFERVRESEPIFCDLSAAELVRQSREER